MPSPAGAARKLVAALAAGGDTLSITARLAELARLRLEQRSRLEEETKEANQLRAEDWCVLGGPRGYVLLPPERD